MGKVKFRCREMVQITFLDKNVVPGSTIYVDPGTHLTQQNQDVHSYLTVLSGNVHLISSTKTQ